MANPTLLTMPLCVNADKNTIPPTDAGTSGLFSEELGFQDINSLPLASGGKAPNRRDFNGVFALLGGIAYACQRGYTFEWVNILPYLKGCVVTDPLDGNKYNAKNDVAEGGTNPSLDPTNWELFGTDPNALTREITPAFNTRDIITTSGTYTAPVTGWYRITAKGGGGGGGLHAISNASSGGGGEGGTTIVYVAMTAGEHASVVVGGGGAYGVSGTYIGGNGGNTSVTIDGNTYTGYGGNGGGGGSGHQNGGLGGDGTIKGCAGCSGESNYSGGSGCSGSGGGAGGGAGSRGASTEFDGTSGGGGAGANGTQHGGNGGDGYVWFEYFATI